MDLTRLGAEALDSADPLAALRDSYVIDPDVLYLDGNSLGRLSRATRDRLHEVIDREWGEGLIGSWSQWMELPTRVGDLIGASLLGAGQGQVVVGDSTTVNLYKLASAALDARPDRRTIITNDDNFPTDLYVLQGLAQARGLELKVVSTDIDAGVRAADLELTDDVALVSLSHVAYRSGALADMAAITQATHDAGALILWDLSHSAGSVDVQLDACDVDLATGCSYKYLNGGPGAPAYSYVNRRLQLRQPIWGWFAQRDQFAMGGEYEPVGGISQFLVGTPQIVQIAGLEAAVTLLAEAGISSLQAKGSQLTEYLIALADARLDGFTIASPREAGKRGSHVVLHHDLAWQITQAMLARKVIPDYRNPQRIRIGPAPIYTRFVDIWDCVEQMVQIVDSQEWQGFSPDIGRVT